jgi:hypothetical protein
MFSHDLKDSEKDIRMLKMIHGVAVKRWKFGNSCQRSWSGCHRLLNVPKIYEGSTTHELGNNLLDSCRRSVKREHLHKLFHSFTY